MPMLLPVHEMCTRCTVPTEACTEHSTHDMLTVIAAPGSTNGKFPPLFTDKPGVADHIGEICRIYLKLRKKNEKIATYNRLDLDLETLVSQLILPIVSPDSFLFVVISGSTTLL